MNIFEKIYIFIDCKAIRQLLIFSPLLMYFPMNELVHNLATIPLITLIISIFFFFKKVLNYNLQIEDRIIIFVIIYILFSCFIDLTLEINSHPLFSNNINDYYRLNIEFQTNQTFDYLKGYLVFYSQNLSSLFKILFPLFIFLAFFNKISEDDISQKLIIFMILFNYLFFFGDHLGYYGLIPKDSFLNYFFRYQILHPNSNLYPEPSYLSINFIYLLFLNSLCKESFINKHILNVIIILPIIYYQSTYGMLLLIIFLSLNIFQKFKVFKYFSLINILKIALIFSLLCFLISIIFFNSDNNFSRDYFNIFKFLKDFNFVDFNLNDPSTTTRIDLFLISILGVSINPFGYGIDSFGYHWYEIAKQFNLYNATNANSAISAHAVNSYEYFYTYKPVLVAQSYLQNLIFSYGIIPLFCIFNIIFLNYKKIFILNFSNERLMGIVIALIIGMIQIQNTNPVWILILILSISVKKKEL